MVWLGSDCASAVPAAPSDDPATSSCCFNAPRSALGATVVLGAPAVLGTEDGTELDRAGLVDGTELDGADVVDAEVAW